MLMSLAVGDDNVGTTINNRLYEIADAILRILVVAVGVDDDIGP